MPFVLSGEQGRVDVAARGVRHDITVRVDRIGQEPVIDRRQLEDPLVKSGTSVCLHWPDSACSILTDAKTRILQIAQDFAFLNPHLTLTIDWCGARTCYEATDTQWKKWLPRWPTSVLWYTAENFERLVAGYLKSDADAGRDRTVRELVAEFDGLTGTAKQKAILEETGLARMSLSALRNGDDLNKEKIAKLLMAMKSQSKLVKPETLGVIGKRHIAARFEAMGADMDTFKYAKELKTTDSIPWVVEAAFAWCPGATYRRLVTGVNWSAAIVNPFRELGRTSRSLDAVLTQQRAGAGEPVLFLQHMARPGVNFTDRGKSAVVIGGVGAERGRDKDGQDDPDDDDW
jgi:DNA topoisomerase VI subunit B